MKEIKYHIISLAISLFMLSQISILDRLSNQNFDILSTIFLVFLLVFNYFATTNVIRWVFTGSLKKEPKVLKQFFFKEVKTEQKELMFAVKKEMQS